MPDLLRELPAVFRVNDLVEHAVHDLVELRHDDHEQSAWLPLEAPCR